ncbi:MAG: glycoside hydrolase family 9 protein [Xanthomonadales bacterium]
MIRKFRFMTSRARISRAAAAFVALACATPLAADLELGSRGYFETPGLNVIVFDDIYPEGHQTGVTVIQHGVRVAANGDLRLEASPGQWSPVPVAGERTVDPDTGTLTQRLSYPDPARDRTGFNPIAYPDLELAYRVSVTAGADNAFTITVDLDEPLPEEWVGRVGFNFELFPGHLLGKAWLMDASSGHFPNQPNGPVADVHGEMLTEPLARGRTLVVAPESDLQRLVIESRSAPLELLDGRANHNNGWFIVRSLVPSGVTRGAVRWTVRPNVVPGWRYTPVIQVSQLGYAPAQPKRVVIEQDHRDTERSPLTLYRLGPAGPTAVRTVTPERWDGTFLRYAYLWHDFSDVRAPGMYRFEYRGRTTQPFRIDPGVFARHAWQPTLEYYLPVQMCHMRVNEKYRAWHGLCHQDDARMAPVDHNHFDGYVQGPSTLTAFAPLAPVPGLNAGGWHDAGDYDLRVESQIGTVWVLAQAVEEFGLDHDATTIDPERKRVEIHQPDGQPDALQQIRHGLASVLGGYRALGRLYRGIIVPTQRQYVLLGDASVQTDNRVDPAGAPPDDRWVFTEDNPNRELYVAGGLAAAARVLRGFDDALAAEALETARALHRGAFERADRIDNRVFALSELLQATGDARYASALLALRDGIVADIAETGWALAKAMPLLDDAAFTAAVDAAVAAYQRDLQAQSRETPYGVPYRPRIWGAGWDIQRFGVRQYFLRKGWPDRVAPDLYLDALNFVLGVHPGRNTVSFASGVGAQSALVAYGVNRADWSHIPGGVISGTALIRPDLPELKTWPFFWQQTEYVMGGGGTNFLFLVLAADALYGR